MPLLATLGGFEPPCLRNSGREKLEAKLVAALGVVGDLEGDAVPEPEPAPGPGTGGGRILRFARGVASLKLVLLCRGVVAVRVDVVEEAVALATE